MQKIEFAADSHPENRTGYGIREPGYQRLRSHVTLAGSLMRIGRTSAAGSIAVSAGPRTAGRRSINSWRTRGAGSSMCCSVERQERRNAARYALVFTL